MPVLVLWCVATLTTVVLNLDTTIVLLTPLYVRLARRTGSSPLSLALVPLLLAGLASSVLPVSNLTTLIAAAHYDLGTGDVVGRLALPSLAAVIVGWLAFARRHPRRLPIVTDRAVDGFDARALRIGTLIVGGLLIGFVFGPSVGVAPWIVALAADVVLIGVVREVPWREVPLGTAVAVAAVGAAVAAVVPADVGDFIGRQHHPAALIPVSLAAAGASGLVNNLPALLASLGRSHRAGWGTWAWLLGVNAGAVLVPSGALANLLWLRVMATEGEPVTWRRYPAVVVPIAAPALIAAIAVLVVERLVTG